MTNISRCCYILRLRVCRLSRGSRCRRSRILQRGGCRSGGAYCVVHSTIHWPAGGHAGGGSSAGGHWFFPLRHGSPCERVPSLHRR
jgi:hypothetical protein